MATDQKEKTFCSVQEAADMLGLELAEVETLVASGSIEAWDGAQGRKHLLRHSVIALREAGDPAKATAGVEPIRKGKAARRRPALPDSLAAEARPVIVNAARFVTIDLCATITGLTRSAINKRMGAGHWTEGRQWHRAEDGSIWIDMLAVERWVQGMP